MRSELDELSISSQASDVPSVNLSTVSQSLIRTSTPLKRSPSNSEDKNASRNDCIRQRTALCDASNNNITTGRLTLRHSAPPAKGKAPESLASSQIRAVRTVSRFFLSSKAQMPEKQDASPVVAKENTSMDGMLMAQKGHQAEKVLQGIKSKFSYEVRVCFLVLTGGRARRML